MEPTWGQHGHNLSQLGANLGPCWVQIGSSRPSCSNHEGILRPLGAHTTKMPKMIQASSKFAPSLTKAREKQRNIGKRRSGSTSRKNDHETTTYQFGNHLGAILASSWGSRGFIFELSRRPFRASRAVRSTDESTGRNHW